MKKNNVKAKDIFTAVPNWLQVAISLITLLAGLFAFYVTYRLAPVAEHINQVATQVQAQQKTIDQTTSVVSQLPAIEQSLKDEDSKLQDIQTSISNIQNFLFTK